MGIEINHDTDYQASADDFAAIAAATEQIANSGQAADAIFRANAKAAATTIVNLAVGASNERIRLDAAKYVVERVMGRVPDTKNFDNDGGAPWDGIYTSCVVSEPSAAQRSLGAAPQSQH